jgi:hypothetical protein
VASGRAQASEPPQRSEEATGIVRREAECTGTSATDLRTLVAELQKTKL